MYTSFGGIYLDYDITIKNTKPSISVSKSAADLKMLQIDRLIHLL